MDAYLCGHDHNLEYLLDAPEGEGVSYFVSGSGGQDVYGVKKTREVGNACVSVSSPPPPHPPLPPSLPPQACGCTARPAPFLPSIPTFRLVRLPTPPLTMSPPIAPLSPLPPPPSPTYQTVFAVAESGFMHHAFLKGGKEMRVDVVNRDGQVLLSKTLRQKRKQTVTGKGGGAGVIGGDDGMIVEVKHSV